jgi:hypothetical protein
MPSEVPSGTTSITGLSLAVNGPNTIVANGASTLQLSNCFWGSFQPIINSSAGAAVRVVGGNPQGFMYAVGAGASVFDVTATIPATKQLTISGGSNMVVLGTISYEFVVLRPSLLRVIFLCLTLSICFDFERCTEHRPVR